MRTLATLLFVVSTLTAQTGKTPQVGDLLKITIRSQSIQSSYEPTGNSSESAYREESFYAQLLNDSLVVGSEVVGFYSLTDSTLVLSNSIDYRRAKIIDGVCTRNTSPASLVIPINPTKNDSVTFEVIVPDRKIKHSLNGYWADPENLGDGFFVCGSHIFSGDLDEDMTATIVNVTAKSMSVELRRDGQAETIEVPLDEGIRVTGKDVYALLEKSAPTPEVFTLDFLDSVFTVALNDSTYRKYAYNEILKEYGGNNYFTFATEALSVFDIMRLSPSASILTDLTYAIPGFFKQLGIDDSFTHKKMVKLVNKELKKQNIALKVKNEPHSIAKGIVLLFLAETSKVTTDEQKGHYRIVTETLRFL